MMASFLRNLRKSFDPKELARTAAIVYGCHLMHLETFTEYMATLVVVLAVNVGND
jgi:hypothetical protein